MDKENFIKETKMAIGYTEEIPQCKDCLNSEEEENKYLDRDWIRICKINPLCHFVVRDSARCNYFNK